MKVKEVIKEAAFLVGDEEVSSALESDETITDEDVRKRINSLLDCYNLILHETATEYLPIRKTAPVSGGKTEYSALPYPAINIIGVYDERGEAVRYKTFPAYFVAEDSAATVVYDAAPNEQTVTDDFAYADTRIGKRVFAYGVACEYCLITGRYTEAGNFNQKYRAGAEGSPVKKGRIIRRAKTWGI